MKRIIVVVGIFLFILSGCARENSEMPNEKQEIEEVKGEIEQLTVDSTSFHYVVDWLSNEEVLFVESNEEIGLLKAFNVKTKEITTIFEETEMITNVLIHPMKEHLLLHTSRDSSSATVKIVTLDGVVQNELVIESAELEIEWNDVNPLHLLFTAFYEDWTFDTFFFNCSDDTLQMLSVDDPFPKWFGTEQFVMFNNEADFGEVTLYDMKTDQQTVMETDNVIQFNTFKDSLFIMEEVESGHMRYSIVNVNGDLLAEGNRAVGQDGAVAFQSTVEWLTEDQVLFIQPNSEGDSVTEQYRLLRLDYEGVDVFMNDVVNSSFICSPNGAYCITGIGFENMIHMQTKEEKVWLIYDDEPVNHKKL